MRYKGTYLYARVTGDSLLYEGRHYSPSQFANHVAGTNRNAWRDLEIRLARQDYWRLAADMRKPETTQA